jgi:hypothetical protein
MRARRAILLAVAGAALTFASVAVAGQTTQRSGPLTATMYAGTHYPNCKELWPVKVKATYNGSPANASAYYRFLVGGSVVGRVNVFYGTRRNRHNRLYHFVGSFYDNTFGPFGANADGQTIVVEVVVSENGHTVYPYYTVHVQKTQGCKPSKP